MQIKRSAGQSFWKFVPRTHVAIHIMQHASYNTLQYIATHRNTPQHIVHEQGTCQMPLLRKRMWPVCRHSCTHTTATRTLQHTYCITPATTHCNTLWHFTTRCDTLQHAATHCSTIRNTATHCNRWQHIGTHCNTLENTATHWNTLQHTATHYSTLQHCNTLQLTATHCNTLQHTATQCNTLVHTLHAGWHFSR